MMPFAVCATKQHFKHFLRVYNRRTFVYDSELKAAGYKCVKIKISIRREARQWLLDNLQPGTYMVRWATYYFAYESDRMDFAMRWA